MEVFLLRPPISVVAGWMGCGKQQRRQIGADEYGYGKNTADDDDDE